MKILFLSRWMPYPSDNGSKIRIFNIIRQLAYEHDVSLISFTDSSVPDDSRGAAELDRYCSSIRLIPHRAFQPRSVRAFAGLFGSKPRSLFDTHSTYMADAVRQACAKIRPDLVVASQIDMLPYAALRPDIPTMLEELELTVLQDAARSAGSSIQRVRSGMTWFKLRAYLRRTLPRLVACTVVSEAERTNVEAIMPGIRQLYVIPNAIQLSDYAGAFGPPKPNTLIFPGALTYRANYDAARYLLIDICPQIKMRLPQAKLRITGSTSGVDLTRLPQQSMAEFTGYVPDVRPLIAESWAAVVPLRSGGGTRLKILEAMALGTPVVSTRKGAEGLDVIDGTNILLADHSHQFADRVIKLLNSASLRDHLTFEARRTVAERYNWDAVGHQLRDIIRRVAAEQTPNRTVG